MNEAIKTPTPIQISPAQMRALQLENELTDIFEFVKITHQLSINAETAMSPYDGDQETALHSAIAYLREKTNNFEQKFFHSKQEVSA